MEVKKPYETKLLWGLSHGRIDRYFVICLLTPKVYHTAEVSTQKHSFHWIRALSYINKLTEQNFPPFFLFFFMYPGGWKHHIYQELMQSEPLLENIVTLEFNSCSTWIGIFVLIWKSAGFYILNRCKRVNSWFSTSQVRGGWFVWSFSLN